MKIKKNLIMFVVYENLNDYSFSSQIEDFF